MATGDSQGPGSELPAPYRSPWRSLAEAITAVMADLRLRLRELSRLNRQGELPLPGFWPASAAALFWPLLLGIVLALMITAAVLMRPQHAAPQANPSGAPVQEAASAGSLEQPLQQQPPAAVPSPMGPQARGSEPGPAPAAAREPDRSSIEATAENPKPQLDLDPLLALLNEEEPDGLLLAASPDPASGTLRLTLSATAAASLGSPQLRQRAEAWQQRALADGYDRLELVDAQGRVLGRQALVGSGMILLAPDNPA